MANSVASIASLVFLAMVVTLGTISPQVEAARAFFVFGDSLVDSGNNDFLATTTRADSYPYGIDYPTHRPTSRFSNGLNIPNLIKEELVTVAVNAVAIILLKVFGMDLTLVGLLSLSSFDFVSSQQYQFPDSPSSPAKSNFELLLGLAAVFVVILATGYCCWRGRSTPEDEGDTETAVVEEEEEEEEEEEPEDEGDIEMAVVEEEEEIEECPICFEDMRDEQYAHPLPQCNDKFHDHCILQWSSRTGSNACPICCRTP